MSDVELKSKVDGSVNEDRVPSSTRIWRSDRSKKRTNPLVLPAAGLAAMQWGNSYCYMESSLLYSRASLGSVFSSPAWAVFSSQPNPPAVPSGAALLAHYPAGTRGDV